MTPKQATPDDRAAFFDWLEEAKAKAIITKNYEAARFDKF